MSYQGLFHVFQAKLIKNGRDFIDVHQILLHHLIKHIQMEIYAEAEQAREIAQLIVDAAHVNADSEGLVCIVPVNDLIWIHDKRSATDNDFQFHR